MIYIALDLDDALLCRLTFADYFLKRTERFNYLAKNCKLSKNFVFCEGINHFAWTVWSSLKKMQTSTCKMISGWLKRMKDEKYHRTILPMPRAFPRIPSELTGSRGFVLFYVRVTGQRDSNWWTVVASHLIRPETSIMNSAQVFWKSVPLRNGGRFRYAWASIRGRFICLHIPPCRFF